MKKVSFLALVLLLILSAIGYIPTASALTYNDDFRALNSFWWQIVADGDTTVQHDSANGRIVMTQGSDGQGNLAFTYALKGDFTATIDFTLLNWPMPNNFERAGIRTNRGAVERISDSRFGVQSELYVTDLAPSIITTTPTSDFSGKLRIERVGNVVSGYYFDGSDWVLIGSNDDGSAPDIDQLWLSIWPFGATPGVQVAFDNFSLLAPTTPDPLVKNDFNGDGKADILWRNTSTGQNAIWYMEGVTLSGIGDLPALPNPDYMIVGTGDFNGDGKTDILWRNTVTGANAIWYMDGVTLTGIGDLPALPNPDYMIMGTGDFNGDGKTDILWRNTATGANAVWYMDGITMTGIADLPALPNPDYAIMGTGDFNGDRKTDILWRNTATGANAIWYMDGATLSGIADLPALPNPDYSIVGTGDFNEDGKPDIIWRNTVTGANAVWYMDGVTLTGISDLPALPNPHYEIVGG